MAKNIKEYVSEQVKDYISYRKGWEDLITDFGFDAEGDYVDLRIRTEDIKNMIFEDHPWIKRINSMGFKTTECDNCKNGMIYWKESMNYEEECSSGFICLMCGDSYCAGCMEHLKGIRIGSHGPPHDFFCSKVCSYEYDKTHS